MNNNLQQIASLLRLQKMHADESGRRAITTIESRISAMKVLYRSLTMLESHMQVELEKYLRALVDGLRTLYAQPGINLEVRFANGAIPLDAAVPIGLIVNEFATNSLKHAFPDGIGTIMVDVEHRRNDLLITLADNGVGIAANQDACGLGLTIISRVGEQLDASVEWSYEKGTRLTARIPLS